MIADRLKALRKSYGLTQSDIARELELTRSSVNAWEMGISYPSTLCLLGLAKLFHTSTDYILGLDDKPVLDISGIDDEGARILRSMLKYMQEQNEEEEED